MATKLKAAATVTVFTTDDETVTHELASDKDWAVIFEDVLEVRGKDEATYYPMMSIKRWTVK